MTSERPPMGIVLQLNTLKRVQNPLARSSALLMARQQTGPKIQINTVCERDRISVSEQGGRAT